jgi:hypothetical protein
MYAISHAFDASHIFLWAPPCLLGLYFNSNMSPHVSFIFALADFLLILFDFFGFLRVKLILSD